MSRPAAAMNPGQTNRRFIILAVVLGLIGAVLVYVAFSKTDSSGGAGGNQRPVVVAKTDIAARTKITASMLEVRLLAQGDVSALAYSDSSDVVGRVTRFPIAANEQVLSTKVVDLSGTGSGSATKSSLSYTVPAGHRAMAVKVDQVISAGGLIIPGDYVDIVVVYDINFQTDPKDPSSHEKEDAFFIQTLYQNIEVLAISQTVVDLVPESIGTPTAGQSSNGQRLRNTEAKPEPEAKTITLSLTPEQAQKVFLAESNGHIRLLVRPYGDSEERPIDPMIETDLWPRSLPNPFIR